MSFADHLISKTFCKFIVGWKNIKLLNFFSNLNHEYVRLQITGVLGFWGFGVLTSE